MRLPSAYILSNNGLGDNVVMIGCVHFLSNFYDNIYFLCKEIYYTQMVYLYKDFPFIHIIPLPLDGTDESNNINKDYLQSKYETSDIFICGGHKNYLQSKITHPYLTNYNAFYKDFPDGFKTFLREPYKKIFPNIDSYYKYIYDNNNVSTYYYIIEYFYTDIRLNLNICYDFFYIPTDDNFIQLYNYISQYNIIFIHSSTSTTNNVEYFKAILQPYLNDNNYIVISPNNNYYNKSDNKYNIAEHYIQLPTIFHYIEIIKNAKSILLTDSCIFCMTMLYIKKGDVKTKDIIVYNRDSLIKENIDYLYS